MIVTYLLYFTGGMCLVFFMLEKKELQLWNEISVGGIRNTIYSKQLYILRKRW